MNRGAVGALIAVAVTLCVAALLWAWFALPGAVWVVPVAILIEAGLAAVLVALLTASKPDEGVRGQAGLLRCPRCTNTFHPTPGARRLRCPSCLFEGRDRAHEVGEA